MIVDLVADVGNSRIKWGLCQDGAVTLSAALPIEDPPAWRVQLDQWGLARPLRWALASVHPARGERLVEWLRQRGDAVHLLDGARQLPLRVRVEHPDRVGIDRLLDAVAANTRREPGAGAVIVDAGSAVTVDWLDAEGTFCGGAILPGLRLMARTLHEHTALLPLIEEHGRIPDVPGTDTHTAIEAGVFWSVVGGIDALVERLAEPASATPVVFLTGGDAPVLEPALRHCLRAYPLAAWPHMTLEGIRLSAEALP
jgi:type III pantothenate kinase